MATKIGQKNGYAIFKNTEFGTNIKENITVPSSNEEIIEVYFTNAEENFSNNFNYYIEGTITKNKSHPRKIRVYLTNEEGTTKYDIAVLNIGVDRIEDTKERTESFKIAFRPGKSSYSRLVFENIADNLTTDNKKFKLEFSSAFKLGNILSGEKIVQLGIQADPGFIFLINGEPIKIGRRGFFEAPEGYEITDIAVRESNFIMDYKYEVMETIEGGK